jgi:hypothetical protein
MVTQQESSAPAIESVSGGTNKLRQLLRTRARQLVRVTVVLLICLALAAAAVTIWWLNSLNGLPDIGDPFDVATFRGLSVPDDQNAFILLRRAEKQLTPAPGGLAVSWSHADREIRKWAESNRGALALFQQAAEQADAVNPAGDSGATGQRLVCLALLEGGRREGTGDMAGAWDCYRAVFRIATHIRRRGSLAQRQELEVYWNGRFYQRLGTWAADPRTTIERVRDALVEALKAEPTPEWDSAAIKEGYLEMMRSLEQPVARSAQEDINWVYEYHLGDLRLSPEMADRLDAACRFLLREPERSRRVLRLLCANWLAHVDNSARRPQTPAVRARFPVQTSANPIRKGTVSVFLYPVEPPAPDAARRLSPQEVAGRLVATNDLKLRIMLASLNNWPWSPDRLRNRAAYRQLVVMLAAELYRRERGARPPSEEALVGTYLKSLPDDGSADLDDGTAPLVP